MRIFWVFIALITSAFSYDDEKECGPNCKICAKRMILDEEEEND